MQIKVERTEFILTIRLNRPEKFNALSREMLENLMGIFERIETDKTVRAVVLTSAGDKSFCAGTDIEEISKLNEQGAKEASEGGQRVCELIENCPVPVITAIKGIAAGGGFEIVLASHLCIASHTAEFSLPETKFGVIPAYGGTQRLTRVIGARRANDLILAGGKISAQQALELGLVNKVVLLEEVEREAKKLAEKISSLAPLAIRACLKAVNKGLERSLAEGLKLETKLFAQIFATEDMREGTRAFLEKRKPVFRNT